MKFWDSVRKQIEYYEQHYGHIFHPVKDFNELLSLFEEVRKINPEDRFETLHTWKLIENYENRFVFSCKPRNEGMLISHIIMKHVAGKVLVDKCDGKYAFYEVPKTIAPKEKVEVVETPEVKEEVKEIFINDIFIPPDYSRRRVDPNRVNKIALNMKKIGQVDPIVIVPIEYAKDIEKIYGREVKKKYKYILIRGRHRIEAKKLLNHLYIRARVIYNDYIEERMKSSVENTLLKKASVYEQSLDFNILLKLGKTEKEIAEKWGIDRSYVNKIKDFARFKDDFEEKDYVLTILTYEALEKLYWIKVSKDIRQYNFIKERIIKAYESGVRKIKPKHIFEWCDEYKKPIEEKGKEIQRKLYGEEIPAIRIQKPIESQQVQLQIEKPISRIPKQEEVKEKIKEVKRKKKEKSDEERFEYNFKIISYSHPKRIVSIIKKILDGIQIEEKKRLNINEIFRKCEEALSNSIMKKSDEEIEKLFRSVIEEILKEEKI
jgi:ParB-like chromosome segregation protein Spo0J